MGHVGLPCLPVEHEVIEEEQHEHQPDEDQPRPERDTYSRRGTHAHIPFTRISHLDLAPPMIETLLPLPY